MISAYLRMMVAIEINVAAFYGFIKTKNPSFILFILSMIALSIGGMSFLANESNTAIFGNAVGLIFLGLIFFIPSNQEHGVLSYFSIQEKLKNTKKALNESESRYLRIFNAAKDAFLIFDLEGNIVDANKKALEMYDYSRQEFLTLSGRDIVHPDYAQLFTKFKQDVVNKGEFQTESIDIKKDGTPFNVEVRGTDIEYSGKKHLLAIVRDVTQRKKAEEQLKKSQIQLATLMGNLPGMAYQCLFDDQWTMKYVSSGCKHLTEYSAHQLLDSKEISYAEIIHPDDRDYVSKTVNRAIHAQEPFAMTYRIITASGKEKWVWEQGVGVFSDENTLLDIEGFITDITEWKKADDELKKLSSFANEYVNLPLNVNLYEDLAQKIKSFVGSGIVIVNRIENEKTMFLESIIGLSKKKISMINRIIGDQKVGKPISKIPEQVKQILTNGHLVEVPDNVYGLFFYRVPKLITNAIEKMMNVQQVYSIGLRHENKIFGNVVIVRTEDIKINKNAVEALANQAAVALDKQRAWKELQRAHEEIRVMNQQLGKKVKQRTQRIEQLLKQKDEFINQLGHDLKNPLGPLINLLPILEKHTQSEKDREIVQVIQRNVGYMKNLVQKTLELARLNSPNTTLSKERVSLYNLVKKLVSQNKYLFEENQISVEINISNQIIVFADKLRLEELINNLLNNAVKYSLERGSVIISAIESEEVVTISIKDSGIGMNEEQIIHVFDEFYKADESRHDFDSSGLGMAICKRIVEKHGGEIWVESPGLNMGSIFYFTLPKQSGQNYFPEKEKKFDQEVHRKIDVLLNDF
jgi:PAS domain S-box-containing protein